MIELHNVSKQYKRTLAIDNVTLKIRNHDIYCLLGRNGAGKTVSLANMPENVSFIESRATQFNMTVSSLIASAHNLQKDFDMVFAEEIRR